ncbi:MAG: PEP-CTERM sorting domain-containing protein [Planctomycetota bacterium]
MQKQLIIAAAAAAALATAHAAHAQVVLSSSTFEVTGMDPDTGDPTSDGYTYDPPYTYAGANQNAITTAGALVDGAGVGGSVGQVTTVGVEDLGGFGGFWGFGNGTGNTLADEGVVSLDTVTSFDQFVITLDASALGVTGNVELQPQIQFQAGPGNTIFQVNTANASVLGDGTFQSFTLIGEDGNGSSVADLNALIPTIDQININFNIPDGGNADAGGIFGFDDDNVITMDNVVLTGPGLIPEPASLGLLGMAGLALVRRRR